MRNAPKQAEQPVPEEASVMEWYKDKRDLLVGRQIIREICRSLIVFTSGSRDNLRRK